MDNSNTKTLSLVCPSCGVAMELNADGKSARCPYCEHEVLIEKSDLAQTEYERQMARARAEEDIKALKAKRKRRQQYTGWLIALCVIVGIFLLAVLIPGSAMHSIVFPSTADPFSSVSVTFSGMSGEGIADLELSGSDSADYAVADRFEISPQSGLSNGDTVTVRAKASAGWRFEPSEKQFTVQGLTEWVLQTDQLTGDNLASIHDNTERLIREDWEEILSSSLAKDMTLTPYRMFLFIADDGRNYERNVLYDAYEVKVTRDDGSVLTSYEACRYADLKIPADGVLTAAYGSLMGFNFGYNHGFSYAHSFSGWTDAAEMEADLRHARDGYHLTE